MQSAAAFCDMVTAHLPSQFETGFPSSHIIETRPVKSVCVSRAMPCHASMPCNLKHVWKQAFVVLPGSALITSLSRFTELR